MQDIIEKLDALVEGHNVDNLALLALQEVIANRQAWVCEVICENYHVHFLVEAKDEDVAFNKVLELGVPKDSVINAIKITQKVTRI